MSSKIPKIIHYCWFGKKEFPKLVHNCIESWKKYLPDYEIMFWNESNFDINMLDYTKEDLLEFYSGEEVKDRYKLIEKEISSL